MHRKLFGEVYSTTTDPLDGQCVGPTGGERKSETRREEKMEKKETKKYSKKKRQRIRSGVKRKNIAGKRGEGWEVGGRLAPNKSDFAILDLGEGDRSHCERQ